MNKIVLHAEDLDGYFKKEDIEILKQIDALYEESTKACKLIDEASTDSKKLIKAENLLIKSASDIGAKLREITKVEKRIHVYAHETPKEKHAQASRLIAKLREPSTSHEEFLYYVQRAYELLFDHVYSDAAIKNKRSLIVKTPVTFPSQNYACHRIPDIDDLVQDSVLCVMLRGALLPSMIISKEIQDNTSNNEVPPFALFKIKRDESKTEKNMDYILDLDRSFFREEDLQNKNWIFADPMNATGGSLVTVVKYLNNIGIHAKSIKFINVISSIKGSLRIIRALDNCEVYTLWMDPVLNEKAYILPGLGDAGDRLNGFDASYNPRNMIQLLADYGTNIINLYRAQVIEIEKTVLGYGK